MGAGCASRRKAPAQEPPPVALIVELKLPPDARLVGGLSGPLRIEPFETMTHAIERGTTANPITFGYDPRGPTLILEEASLPGGRSTFPVKPPYPQKHSLALSGVAAELEVKPAKP